MTNPNYKPETEIKTSTSRAYWKGEGAYQKEMSTIFEEMVPVCGSAKTLTGELVRAANRLYYEAYNNGNCNALEQTVIWNEDDDEDYETSLSDYYAQFIELIRKTLNEAGDHKIIEIADQIEDIILDDVSDYHIYDELLDHVAYYAIHHTGEYDSEIPNWYEKD